MQTQDELQAQNLMALVEKLYGSADSLKSKTRAVSSGAGRSRVVADALQAVKYNYFALENAVRDTGVQSKEEHKLATVHEQLQTLSGRFDRHAEDFTRHKRDYESHKASIGNGHNDLQGRLNKLENPPSWWKRLRNR